MNPALVGTQTKGPGRAVGCTSERLRAVLFPVVRETPSGNVRDCAPVRFGDLVFQILKANPPQASPADLNRAQLSTADQPPDEARLHVELFGCLLDCQETALGGLISHCTILWAPVGYVLAVVLASSAKSKRLANQCGEILSPVR